MESSRTTTALLEGLLASPEDSHWSEFADRYRPIILGWARRMGLGHDDAADVAQETMLRFLRDYRAGKYERGRGRLRSWILAIARGRYLDLQRARGARAGQRGESALTGLGDEDRTSLAWEEEWQRSVTRKALDVLRRSSDFTPATIQAFELYALEARPVAQVAETTGLSVRAVYMAKHHCARRLRALAGELEAAYEL